MLAGGSCVCALVVAVVAVDTEATEGTVVGLGVVAERVGVDPLVMLTTGQPGDVWEVGLCADVLGAWALVADVTLAVELPVVGPEGLCLLTGLPVLGLVVATVSAPGAAVVATVPGNVPPPGACAGGVLRGGCLVAAVDEVCEADVGTDNAGPVGALGDVRLVRPAVAAVIPASVLFVVSVVTSVELVSVTKVPLVNVTGEGITTVILSDVLFSALAADSPAGLSWTE